MRRPLLLLTACVLISAPASAAPRRPAPAEPPPPTPEEWWTAPEPLYVERLDPLGDRRPSRNELERRPQIPAAPEPSYYRLWGLHPLQAQAVRRGDTIIEVWARPEGGVRQAVIRVTVRSDDRAFLQARAGVGCCKPEIGRRVDIDVELEPGWRARLASAAREAAWQAPSDVVIQEAGGALETVCVGGVSYDLYLLERDRAAHLRRDCGGPEVGSVADILEPVIGAALGREPRFDFLFPRGASFANQKAAYQDLVTTGGKLSPPTRR